MMSWYVGTLTEVIDPLSDACEDFVGVRLVVNVEGGGFVVAVERVLPGAFETTLLSNNAAANISAEAVTRRSDEVNI